MCVIIVLMRLKSTDKHLPSVTGVQLLLPQSRWMDPMICGRVFHPCFTEVPTILHNCYGLLVFCCLRLVCSYLSGVYSFTICGLSLPYTEICGCSQSNDLHMGQAQPCADRETITTCSLGSLYPHTSAQLGC